MMALCQLKKAAKLAAFSGGTWRIRTAVPGFADRSLTARARYQTCTHKIEMRCKGTAFF